MSYPEAFRQQAREGNNYNFILMSTGKEVLDELCLNPTLKAEALSCLERENRSLSLIQIKAILAIWGMSYTLPSCSSNELVNIGITIEGFITKMKQNEIRTYLEEVKFRSKEFPIILENVNTLLNSFELFEDLGSLMKQVKIRSRRINLIKSIIWLTFLLMKKVYHIELTYQLLIELFKYFSDELLRTKYPLIKCIKLRQKELQSYQNHLSLFNQVFEIAYCLQKRSYRQSWLANGLGGVFSRRSNDIIRFIDDIRKQLRGQRIDEACFLNLPKDLVPEVSRHQNLNGQSICKRIDLNNEDDDLDENSTPESAQTKKDLRNTGSTDKQKNLTVNPKVNKPFSNHSQGEYRLMKAKSIKSFKLSVNSSSDSSQLKSSDQGMISQ